MFKPLSTDISSLPSMYIITAASAYEPENHYALLTLLENGPSDRLNSILGRATNEESPISTRWFH